MERRAPGLHRSAGEAKTLTGIDVNDRAAARVAGRELLERGAGMAVIEAGKEGDLLVWKGGEHFLPRIPVKAVDPTGAGDAFAGALAACLARGESFVEAGTVANAAAALTTTALGAQAPAVTEAAIRRLLERPVEAR